MGWWKERRQIRLRQNLIDQIVFRPPSFVAPVDREHGWEYLYFASELNRYLDLLRPDAEHLAARRHRTTRAMYGYHFADISDAINTIGITVGLTEFLCSPEHLQRRLLQADRVQPADVALLAGEFAGVYQNLLHIADDLTTTHYGQYTELAEDVADTVLAPLREMESFAHELDTSLRAAVAQVRSGQPMTTPLQIKLTITMDDAVAQRLMAEVNRLKQNPPPQR